MDANRDLYIQHLTYNRHEGPYQCLSLPWWIQAPHKVYQPRHACHLEVLNCGESVFRAIEGDIRAAGKTIDLITWGFDPGMVLVRDRIGDNGVRCGDLLIAAAARGVVVRLLLWHDDLMSHAKMSNNPGYYGARFPTIGASAGFLGESHERYNATWFDEVRAGTYPNIVLRVRKVDLKYRDCALAGEHYDIKAAGWLGSLYATHHQKMLLIDYESPAKVVGYVMGHNFTTDFWDTVEHRFHCSRRETLYRRNPAEMHSQFDRVTDSAMDFFHGQMMPEDVGLANRTAERTMRFIKNHSFTAKPYQDVSLRVQGSIVYDLNHNFCEGWADSQAAQSTIKMALWMASPGLAMMSLLAKKAASLVAAPPRPEPDPEFIERRRQLVPNSFSNNDAHSAQLIRTQPVHGEKGVKECYANLTRQLQHYIFIQNQYVQYQDWAIHLKRCVNNQRAAGVMKPFYVFILTSTPESTGMDLPTYDLAQRLGQSHTMVVEHAEAVKEALRREGEMPITPKQLAKSGINVVMCSLWTGADKPTSSKDYEEIYIHSKVAIVDDAAFTLGSANLNVRSMALDSELNVLSQALDVTYGLRTSLFKQCSGNMGPGQFGDMSETLKMWQRIAQQNSKAMRSMKPLSGQLTLFQVDRKPGSPVL